MRLILEDKMAGRKVHDPDRGEGGFDISQIVFGDDEIALAAEIENGDGAGGKLGRDVYFDR